MNPVTVIVTCFNLERYIGEAIKSVLAQDCADAPEIIVVDDCSTDRSEEVIRSYPVRYIRTHRNGGSLLAMLAGLECASNDIICLLDGDDLWRAEKIRKVSDGFAADPRIAFVTHDLRFVDDAGTPISRSTRPSEVLSSAPRDQQSDLIRRGILMQGDYVWLGSALSFRRSAAQSDQFAQWARSLPDPANTYQDWPLAFWIAANPDAKLCYLPDVLFDYRLHDSNHSGDASTSAKALRNFQRTRNTVAAMREIASMQNLGSDVEHGLSRRLSFLDYVIDLYSGRKARAALGWLRTLSYTWRARLFRKEAVRFLAIQALGAERFARISARRKVFKNLPVS